MVLECTCKNKKFHLKLPCSVVLLQKKFKIAEYIFWMRSIFGQLALNLTPKLIEAQFSDYLTDFCAVAQPCENGGSCFDAPGLDPPYGQLVIA